MFLARSLYTYHFLSALFSYPASGFIGWVIMLFFVAHVHFSLLKGVEGSVELYLSVELFLIWAPFFSTFLLLSLLSSFSPSARLFPRFRGPLALCNCQHCLDACHQTGRGASASTKGPQLGLAKFKTAGTKVIVIDTQLPL